VGPEDGAPRSAGVVESQHGSAEDQRALGWFARSSDGTLLPRRMRLHRALPDEAAWLAGILTRISAPFGSRVQLIRHGALRSA
jgi:hypothetical protein